MKEKKKRKILAALIPVAVFLLAAVVFAQGVLKSEPEACLLYTSDAADEL